MGRDERLERLTQTWRWLFEPSSFELLEISPFGDLLLRDAAGVYWLLDVNFGRLEGPAARGGAAAEMFPDNFDGRLAGRYRAAEIELREGQCYAYTTLVIAKEGSFEPSNVWAAPMEEYVRMMGDLHGQLRGVADGTQVRVVAKNLRGEDHAIGVPADL